MTYNLFSGMLNPTQSQSPQRFSCGTDGGRKPTQIWPTQVWLENGHSDRDGMWWFSMNLPNYEFVLISMVTEYNW